MKNNNKYSVVAGILMFVLAALACVSLLLVAIDFGGNSPAHNSIFYLFGKMITKVYGFCSLCIPLFFVVAGFQCFSSKWEAGHGVVLIGSVIPFFTLDAVEHVIRMLASSESGSVMLVKISSALLIGGMLIAAEFILLTMLGHVVTGVVNRRKEKNNSEEVENEPEVETEIETETESEEDFDNQEDEHPFAPEEDSVEISEDENDGEELPETESDAAEETETVEENQEQDDPFDFKNDKLFHEQQKLLKDLINVGKTEQQVQQFEKELSEREEIFNHENEAEDEDKTVVEETEPEAAGEENPEDNPIVEIMTRQDPFDLPEPAPQSFDDDDFEEPEIDAFNEPVLVDEYRFDGNSVEDEENSDEFAIESADDTFIQEEEIPVSEDDFEQPEVADHSVEFESAPEEADDLNDSAMTFAADEDELSMNEFSPVVDSEFEAESVENDVSDEFVEIEDIFSQMDEEAAYNPVVKEKDSALLEEDAADYTDPLFEQQKNIEEETTELSNLSDELEQTQSDNVEIYDFEDISEPDEISSEPVLEKNLDYEQMELSAADETNSPASDVNETVDVTDDFFGEEDDEDRSLHDVDGLEPHEESKVPVEEFDEENAALDVIDAEEKSYIEAPDEVDFQEINSEEDAEEFEIDENLSEEDKKAGITAEDDPYERKQKRTIANYKISPDLLNTYENGEYWVIDEETKQAGQFLKQTLAEFGIEAEVTGIRKGPVVTMYELLPAPGVRLSKIVSLQDNIALSLAAKSVRIVAPIPGKHAVGIEVPNKQRAVVSFREIIEEKLSQFDKMQIPVILGKDISGEPQLIDLAKTPHLLIAGSTGAGKSVCVNSMILSILYKRSPQQVKLVLIDPKVVELKLYNDIPHLLTPVITEPKKALQALQYCLCEMERRYALLDGMGVRDIVSYNKKIVDRRIATEKLPYIVVIIDEFADLMATTGRELESNVSRLCAMSRAVGIHLVLATQRPSVNVITGLIKANIPSRIAFMVASRQDSQIIIDGIGAEKLLGKGDMLYSSATDPFPTRIQGTLVGDDEVERVVNEVKQYGEPEYIDDEIFVEDEDEESAGPGLFSDGEDPLYDQALQIVVQAGKASASYIQRRLKIGYNRAARLVEDMEARGIVGPANGSKPREVIHTP